MDADRVQAKESVGRGGKVFQVRYETAIHESAEVKGALGRRRKVLEQSGVEPGKVPRPEYVPSVEAQMIQVDAAAQNLADRGLDGAVGDKDSHASDEWSDTWARRQLLVQAGEVVGESDDRGVHEREAESPQRLGSVNERSNSPWGTAVGYGLHNVRAMLIFTIAVVQILLVTSRREVNDSVK